MKEAVDPIDCWEADDFEDMVAAALIACFETKIKKDKELVPSDRLTDDRVMILRNHGPYIPSASRVIIGASGCETFAETQYGWKFDVVNDPLPVSGCVAIRPGDKILKEHKSSYLVSTFIRRTQTLGRFWNKQKGGQLFEMLQFVATADAIHGGRTFFTVSSGGAVTACVQRANSVLGYAPGKRAEIVETEESDLRNIAAGASIALQYIADRRFCWSITAQEKSARAHLGCMREEIKSLLYARSLPMTSTGRKRPILHLVEAHKRRMRSGTEVDISTFLRGQQIVEIGGTVFKVNPPPVLAPLVPQGNRIRFFESAAV